MAYNYNSMSKMFIHYKMIIDVVKVAKNQMVTFILMSTTLIANAVLTHYITWFHYHYLSKINTRNPVGIIRNLTVAIVYTYIVQKIVRLYTKISMNDKAEG